MAPIHLHVRDAIRNSQDIGFRLTGWSVQLFLLSKRNLILLRKAKRPPGNRVTSSLGRIVPTEAKPSELSGEILSLPKSGVKA